MSKGNPQHLSLFLVIEGIDGSGTTTQCELLVRRLERCGHAVTRTREPGGTPVAERLRQIVLDPSAAICDVAEMLLYAACRAQHVHEVIGPALDAGRIVVSDRFLASSLAYQGVGRGLGIETVRAANRESVGDCRPDLTLYLDLPVAVADQRRRARATPPDRLEQAGDDFQGRVAAGFLEVARRESTCAVVLDASQDRDALAAAVWEELLSRWPWLSGPRSREKGTS